MNDFVAGCLLCLVNVVFPKNFLMSNGSKKFVINKVQCKGRFCEVIFSVVGLDTTQEWPAKGTFSHPSHLEPDES